MGFLRSSSHREGSKTNTLLPDHYDCAEADFAAGELPASVVNTLSKQLIQRLGRAHTCHLGTGGYSSVFALSSTLALKSFRYSENSFIDDATREALVAAYLRSEDIAAPRQYGLLLHPMVDAYDVLHENHPALVMQRLHETPYDKLSFLERWGVRRWHVQSKKKIRDLGLIVCDSSIYHNVIYDRTSRQPYFIDFSHWRFANNQLTLDDLKERFPLNAYDLTTHPCRKLDNLEQRFRKPSDSGSASLPSCGLLFNA